jgi:hypothetical protein
MRKRLLQLLGVVVTIAVVSLALVAAQAPTTASKTAPVLKTSWGEPDLQGLWSDEYQTPLQRPAKYAGKEVFTDAERAQLDKERSGKPFGFGDKRAAKGSENDVAGAYDSRVFLSRRPSGRRTSLIVDPPDGRVPPFTPAIEKRNAELREFYLGTMLSTGACKEKLRGCEGGTYGPPSPKRNAPHPYYPTGGGFPVATAGGYINRSDGPEDRGLSERCLGAILPDFGSAAGNVRSIVQSPGSVSMFYDTGQGQSWHRIIPVDGSSHLPASIRLWWGDSRGHWEGNTLVVDVTNFSPKTDFLKSREHLHLLERWTRTGPTTLEYVVTMNDPTTWTKPWTVKQEYTKQGDQFNRVYKEPRCHEGNLGMTGLLAGARAEEQAFAEGRGPDPATLNSVVEVNAALDDEDLDNLQ